jgi:UDP-N-acetylmuramoyl-tripeptide--D-alanyl-D-alanine ligase
MATPIPQNHASFTLAEIAQATGGVMHGDSGTVVRGVVTDTRVVMAGALFVALRGERFDAHAFLGQAAEQGAAALLVDEKGLGAATPSTAFVVVRDTTRALGDLARFHRDRWGGVVVGIGGSAGKTSTKELTAAALAAAGAPVHRTFGNLNNHIGVPMTLFELTDTVKTAVIEIGTNSPGEVARLTEIARPNVGVITLVAPEHLEGLGSLAGVAEEEAQLLLGLDENGIAIANGDASILAPWLGQVRAKTVWRYGVTKGADLEVVSAEVSEDLRTQCLYRFRKDGRMLGGRIALLGEGAAMNVAAAISVAFLLGHDIDQAMAALESVEPTGGRMRPRPGARGVLVLDDTYNANPKSMDLAIETGVSVAQRRNSRLVAVLGAMGELGASSREHHLLVGERVHASGAAIFIGAGQGMAPAVELARSLGMAHAEWVPDSAAAATLARSLVEPSDVVLVKGSRSLTMERVVEALALSAAAEGSPAA